MEEFTEDEAVSVEEAAVVTSAAKEVTEGDGRSSDDPRNDPGPPRPEDAL